MKQADRIYFAAALALAVSAVWLPASAAAAQANTTLAELAADDHPTLTYLADRQAIEDLEIAYATAHNTTNPDIYRRIFTQDAQITSATGTVLMDGLPRILKDVATDRERFNAQAKPGTETYGDMRHIITNTVVAVHGDTADATCYLLNTAYNPDTKKPEILSMGRYADQLVKQDGEWRIRRRALISDWGNDELAKIIGVGPYTPKKYR